VRDVVSDAERVNQDLLGPRSVFTTKIISAVTDRHQRRRAYAFAPYEIILIIIIIIIIFVVALAARGVRLRPSDTLSRDLRG
jgi:hypothetical protein